MEAWERLLLAWERKQAVRYCCTIQLVVSCTDKTPEQITQKLFVASCAFVFGSVNRLKHLQVRFCQESPVLQGTQGNDSAEESTVKAGMVLTTSLLALIFIQAGVALKSVSLSCDRHMFDSNVDVCLSDFNRSMESRSFQDECPWPAAKRFYYKLKTCVDIWSRKSRCHGFLIDRLFLEVHQSYFRRCESQLQDPPLFTLIMLLAPVLITTLILPILCSKLVSWNSETPVGL